MNKRQKKKAYKKKYGHNPPKTEMEYHIRYWKRTAAMVVEDVSQAIHNMIPVIKATMITIEELVKSTTEYIKLMPEEEFDRLLEHPDVNNRTKVLANQIRRTNYERINKNSHSRDNSYSKG